MTYPGYHLLDAQTVAFRAVCLGINLQPDLFFDSCCRLGKTNHVPELSLYQKGENNKIIRFALENDMCQFLESVPGYNPNDPVFIRRFAVDQLAVYMWTLGLIDQIPCAEAIYAEETLCTNLIGTGDLASFVDNSRLRTIEEMYPLEVALDLYGYRTSVFIGNYYFNSRLKERILNSATDLHSRGYLVSAPSDDLVWHGQRLSELDIDELREIQALAFRRVMALFYVFGKIA